MFGAWGLGFRVSGGVQAPARDAALPQRFRLSELCHRADCRTCLFPTPIGTIRFKVLGLGFRV